MKFLIAFLTFLSFFNPEPAIAQRYAEEQSGPFINHLKNPGFEQGLGFHSYDAGTASLVAPGREGSYAAKNTFTSVNGTLQRYYHGNCSNMTGENMMIGFYFKTTTANLQICSMDGSNEQQCLDVPSTGNWEPVFPTMVAGSNSCGYKIKTKSSTSGDYTVDSGYIGKNWRVGSVARAPIMLRAYNNTSSTQAVATTRIAVTTLTSTYENTHPSQWNAATGTYTVPVASTCSMSAAVHFPGGTFSSNITGSVEIRLNTGGTAYGEEAFPASSGPINPSATATRKMPAGGTIQLMGSLAGGTSTMGDYATTYLDIACWPDEANTVLAMNTPSAPTVHILTSGSGTFTVPSGGVYLEVEAIGGGGGGSGGSTIAAGNGGTGGNGGNTTFGSPLIVANGGAGAQNYAGVGSGGTASITAPASGIALRGAAAQPGWYNNYSTTGTPGPRGAGSPFGDGAPGAPPASAGGAPVNNTGTGGGGAGAANGGNALSGAGGAAGGYARAMIPGPLAASYSFAVGAGGAAGPAGTGGFSGGAGASGIIRITVYYSTTNMPLIRQGVVYDTVVRAEKMSGVTSQDYGTYTPSFSNTVNITGTPTSVGLNWIRVGNMVFVNGQTSSQCTAASNTVTEISVSLPVASTFSNTVQINGGVNATTGSQEETGVIYYNATYNTVARMYWLCKVSGGPTLRRVNFMYTIQ